MRGAGQDFELGAVGMNMKKCECKLSVFANGMLQKQ